ncbi:MAG: hypothetical protein ABSC03_01740 [Verrucomicrobiota bacterium]|jgi:hypothetical protein
MKRPTKSEDLFKTYCEALSYTVNNIPEAPDRTPDFRVTTPHGEIIAEVKEARPNEEDVRIATQGRLFGRASWCDLPGKRVRAMLDKATGQTRSFSDERLPCVLILYDNVVVDGFRPKYQNYFFSGFDLASGMYGQLKTVVTFAGREVIGTKNELGGNRTLRTNKDQQMSAVCVLTDGVGTEPPFMRVYHNSFAALPLPREIFSGLNDKHLKNPGDEKVFLNSWVEF